METPNNLRSYPLKNIDRFIQVLRDSCTNKVIMTGTRTDPQLYKHEEKLIQHIRQELPGVHISLHTNGLLAPAKIDVFNMYDSSTISINSFRQETYHKLHGVNQMPDLRYIISNAPRVAVKLSCVLTEDNVDEVGEYLEIARSLGIRRVALRHVYGDSRRWPVLAFAQRTPVKLHQSNPVYDLGGLEVTHWIFDKTSGHSLNLFSDGTLSAEYLLTKAPNQALLAHAAAHNTAHLSSL